MPEKRKLERLLEPGQIGNMTLKNRMKVAAATTSYCTLEGRVTERERNFLAERARGGVALVTTGAAHITAWGKLVPAMMAGHDDSLVPELSQLAQAIKSNGAKACFQVIHCGRYAYAKGEAVGPSAITPHVPRFQTPRELTVGEIQDLVKAHANAAWRGKMAGFDCVEICANAGYLIASFLCPATNHRTDKYGGSLENRARFLVEIVDAMKGRVGKDCPVIVRICGDELTEGGNTPEDMRRIAQLVEAAGMDAISVSVGWHDSRIPAITADVPSGHWLYLAEGMKKALNIPVLMAYRLNSAQLAEEAIAQGKLDFWEMARPLFADPYLPQKVAQGRPEDIAPCIGCCQRCFDYIFKAEPVGCIMNPRMGHEGEPEYEIRPAATRKKVLVVGGGPAGMEAAMVAALRGHRVSLYEKGGSLGGLLQVASIAPTKGEIANITRYLSTQLKKAGVEVHLNAEVTPQTVADIKPDTVIVATGATPIVPNIPGVRAGNVVTATDALAGRQTVGDNVVVVGGGMVGCEAAEWLANKGKRVTIIEMLERIANDVGATTRWTAVARLRKAGVRVETKVRAEEITDKGVRGTRNGSAEFFPGDSIVLAIGLTPEKGLSRQLEGKVGELYAIGDCVEPRRIGDAIKEGFLVANKL